MYQIVSNINETTSLAVKQNVVYILKKIDINEAELYRAIMGINSDKIAKHYEFATIESNLYIVEEYINGVTLKEYCEHNHPLSNDKIIEIANGICEGLSAIHSAGIVHRDITPTNIMISANGSPVIIDFGISRLNKPEQAHDTQILGTQGFAAPEQYGFSQTNQKADIYSIGVLINYMATLKMPTEELPKGKLAHIIKKCVAINANKRYSNIYELTSALNKGNIEGIIRSIPGFRRGKGLHIVLAGTYYAMLPIIFYILYTSGTSIFTGICNILIGIFTLILPVPIITNYKDWTYRWSLTKSLPRSGKIAIQIVAVIICYMISLIFILPPEI